MALTLIGINFNTAPLAIREQLHFRNDIIHQAYQTLHTQAKTSPLQAAVILATCNRMEIYSYGKQQDALFAASLHFISAFHNVAEQEITPYLYRMYGARAVLHLFKVSAGLKSMVIGENQILGQVKTAYLYAQKHNFLSAELHRSFEQALAVGKRVRSHTAINKGGTSLGSIAIDFIKDLYGKNNKLAVMLIGAGEIGAEVLKTLNENKSQAITIVNRNVKKAAVLAKRFQAHPLPLTELYASLPHNDVVISSIETPAYLVTKPQLLKALAGSTKVIIFIDLAVPRSIDPAIEDLANIVLYTIDDLKKVIDRTLTSRQHEVESALEIINDFEEEFSRWEVKRNLVQILKDLKTTATPTQATIIDQLTLNFDLPKLSTSLDKSTLVALASLAEPSHLARQRKSSQKSKENKVTASQLAAIEKWMKNLLKKNPPSPPS